ncbi:hypothetical protein LPTSP4_14380 [Leptospira ryugenii]|uniref:PF07614 family protein n=2 Tax=Leptospira ryugenii TaxID=1917863 RepID=A0A2P2DZ61_9LEPT|nr:hypothetical protein LPTSP4_14380 [Leptospira ryugenii]
MDHIAEKEQKNHVIIKYLIGKPLKAHNLGLDQSCFMKDVVPGTDHAVLELSLPIDFKMDPKLTLSIVLARYIEIHCTFVKSYDSNLVEVKVDKIAIAKKERAYPRFPITEEGFVKATNIISSKTIIEANMFNIPTLVRVSFEEYEKKLKTELGPNANIVVDVFKNDLPNEFEVIKRLMKPIFLADCYEESSFEMQEEGFLSYSEEVDDQIQNLIKKYKDKQIESELFHPIIYINELEEHIPIGYVWIQTKESKLSRAKVDDILRLTKEMVERIKDANLMTTEDKFPVVDVSYSGIRLRINHPHLMTTLPKQKGFAVDLFFKMQAPFHFFVRVAWVKKIENGDMELGLEFTGKSRVMSEKSRFEQNIEMVKQLAQGAFA